MKSQQALGPAVVGAIGVVFGDIGTSPLYALGSALSSAEFVPGDDFKVLGLLSLIFWSLLIMVTIKYVGVVMRADNAGEGGVLSLVALVQQHFGTAAPWIRHVVALGVLGAALFYCDALITPAISVLSAVEGLKILHGLHDDPRLLERSVPAKRFAGGYIGRGPLCFDGSISHLLP
jgi:KUP system potassium uptake protein